MENYAKILIKSRDKLQEEIDKTDNIKLKIAFARLSWNIEALKEVINLNK